MEQSCFTIPEKSVFIIMKVCKTVVIEYKVAKQPNIEKKIGWQTLKCHDLTISVGRVMIKISFKGELNVLISLLIKTDIPNQ